MDGERVGTPSDESRGKQNMSATAIFNKNLPYYLAIGMTYEQYWFGDNDLVRVYREADEIRTEKRNQEMWLQGMYIYEALCDVAPILVTVPKKNAKIEKYSEKPYPVTKKAMRQEREEKEKRRENDIKIKMEQYVSIFNKKFGGEK